MHGGFFIFSICAATLRVCSSGSDLPVIDLSQLSPGMVAEAVGADLVVLEGMGRAIETNLRRGPFYPTSNTFSLNLRFDRGDSRHFHRLRTIKTDDLRLKL